MIYDVSLDNPHVAAKYEEALAGLQSNTVPVHDYPRPVLIEGGGYPGIWLECGPLESLIYGRHEWEVAIAGHDIFFHHQREDGYLPCYVWFDRKGDGQIQMVVPIASTALETAEMCGDEAFLTRAYVACSRWDDWLMRYRNTRGTGLCEAFCEFDTGHDNSPRWHGSPRSCPRNDARVCPDAYDLPFLAPDLSATVYGGRVALSRMAAALGKPLEAEEWAERAEFIRLAILKHCFDPEDEFFYDVDINGSFRRVRGDVITRVLGEHVVDKSLFERIYARHIRNPSSFWTPYPLPSIAVDDPGFVKNFPENSWGGASQALTALRAPRWFNHYGKQNDLDYLMSRWIKAIVQSDGFMQQMNPWTGEFSTAKGYSPSMCVMIDFTARLANRTTVLAPSPL